MDDNDQDAEWAREQAEEEVDQRRKAEPPPAISRDEFLAWRAPRLGQANPTKLDNPLWHWMVRTRWSAYQANEILKGPSPFDSGPMWCFDRFGQSETTLPDGRVVHIGGEHEDHYDPDFFIYNDVTVVAPDGSITVLGYPHEVFAPTDFHTATAVGDSIFIIGGVGYAQQRVVGDTPVFRLDLDSMAISRVTVTGDAPGWVREHSCSVSEDARSIILRGGEVWRGEGRTEWENVDSWSLDLARGQWTRLTDVGWPQWTMWRTDRKRNRLWDTRQALWDRDHAWPGMTSYWKHDHAPEFDALAVLYHFEEGAPAPAELDYNTFAVTVDGVRVRFTEGSHTVRAVAEGQLSPERLDDLKRRTLATLERLDHHPWQIDES
jgi:hypothetical protein